MFCHWIVAVELLNVSLTGKRFSIKLIAVGLFSLNVLAVRHFVMNFLRPTFCYLLFHVRFLLSHIQPSIFSSNSLLLFILPLELKPLPLIFFHKITYRWILTVGFLLRTFFLEILLGTFWKTHFSLSDFCCKTNSRLSLCWWNGFFTVRLSVVEIFGIGLILSNFLLSELLSSQFQIVFVRHTLNDNFYTSDFLLLLYQSEF